MATVELTKDLLVEIGGWAAMKEARGLVERGRVSDARREGEVIRARVQGAEKVHEPRITLAERVANIEVQCTCMEYRKAGRVCPHILAAGLAVLSGRDGSPLPSAKSSATDAKGLASLPKDSGDPQRLPTGEKPQLIFKLRSDGALVLLVGTRVPSRPLNEGDGKGLPSLPKEVPRVISRAQIPDFLSRDWPSLERNNEIVYAPGFEEFRLEIGQPSFVVKLEGALSGLTLELFAHYEGGAEYSLAQQTNQREVKLREEQARSQAPAEGGKLGNEGMEPSAYQRYVPDARQANRFWRRNVLAEREALAQVEAAGFSPARGGAAFSLPSENKVARFLANTLPRWRKAWTVDFGPRLTATMAEIDVAEPEFSLRPESRSSSGEDWLSLDLKLSVGGKPVPLDQAEIQRWLQTGQSHTRTPNKRVLLVPTEAWREMREVLADCAVDQEPGRIRVARTFSPYLSGALTAQGFSEGTSDAVRRLTTAAAAEVKAALDEKLWAQLRPYQAQGVEWLAGLAQRNFHGLLADDMGLGKTLQALAFCSWLGRDGSPLSSVESSSRDAKGLASLPRKTLVVCPTSLVTNWLREAARFTPHLRTLDLTGADRAEKFARRKDYDLLVTSYAILRRDVELYRGDEFALVILDEAQHIKNRGSQNAQSAKALRARHRLILTGTPLENSVLDLWSLYDFLLPGYLGTAAEFKERYEVPLGRGSGLQGQRETEFRGEQGRSQMKFGNEGTQLMERLRHRVRPFFLRRTKEEVLTELPPKLEFPTLCELSDEQKEVYRAVLAQGRREVFEHSDKEGRKSGRDRLAVLTTLLRLRQVCCHLDLLPTEGGNDGITKLSKLTELGEGSHGGLKGGEEGEETEATESRGQVRSQMESGNAGKSPSPSPGGRRLPTETEPRWKEPSAKMERTFELIDEAMDGGHRVLLFSQFVKVLHLLREEAKRRELRFCYLDGQTVERQAEVDRFQGDAGIPLFFISLKAGGTGLNLTGADTVIHFDPWWNPAVEEQATSRAHRMGQSRSVSAYKLIAAGTVEEKIQALQARKRELFEASLSGDEAFVEKLSGEDLEELLAE
jgi:hypothetical protein